MLMNIGQFTEQDLSEEQSGVVVKSLLDGIKLEILHLEKLLNMAFLAQPNELEEWHCPLA